MISCRKEDLMVVAGRAVLAFKELSDLIGFSKNENIKMLSLVKILQSRVVTMCCQVSGIA